MRYENKLNSWTILHAVVCRVWRWAEIRSMLMEGLRCIPLPTMVTWLYLVCRCCNLSLLVTITGAVHEEKFSVSLICSTVISISLTVANPFDPEWPREYVYSPCVPTYILICHYHGMCRHSILSISAVYLYRLKYSCLAKDRIKCFSNVFRSKEEVKRVFFYIGRTQI